MRLQAFRFGHDFYGTSDFFYTFLGYFLKGHVFHKTVQVYATVLFGVTVCGQCMVSSGSVIACALWRIVTYKYRTGIHRILYIKILVSDTNNIMFRAISVSY